MDVNGNFGSTKQDIRFCLSPTSMNVSSFLRPSLFHLVYMNGALLSRGAKMMLVEDKSKQESGEGFRFSQALFFPFLI